MSNIHIVKAGDTLWGISKKYGTTVNQLAKINNLQGKSIHNIKIGEKILLNHEDKEDSYETKIKIIILDLGFNPILNATLQLEFDGRKIIRKTENGIFENIFIDDHSKGLKVYYKNINGVFDLIADHKKLPIGKKVLKLTSRKIKVVGSHHAQSGQTQITIDSIIKDLKKMGKPIVDDLGDLIGINNTKEDIRIPSERIEQKRTDNGNSTHIVAAQFTEDNFLLKPINNKYRSYIISAAKRHGFTPHALAAVIDAEAAKLKKTGEWDVNSRANSSSAAGLTQFLDATWIEMCKNQKSLVGQYVQKNPNLTTIQKLNLRFNAEMAIDAAAAYAISNFKASGLPYQNLTEPSSMAKFAYLLHHEGSSGGKKFVLNNLTEDRAHKLLFIQFGKNGEKQATSFLKRYKNAKQAYGAWLRNYIDGHINIYQYVVDKSKTSGINLSMDETIKLLNGAPISSPEPKITPDKKEESIGDLNSKNNEQTSVGGAEGWNDPLAVCKLRTAGLANAKGATFGKVRNNGTKNHQGVDLQANPGTSIYAVSSGIIVAAMDTGGAYGKVIVLKVDIDDLPDKQKKYAKKNIVESKYVYFFYAHLSAINVDKNDLVDVGEVIGKSGATGNANKMTTIANGAHLHFEARSAPLLGIGLTGRIDPIPFINANLPY
ncbi:peptidoglycan DD-metalloendopeptidase family protein [Acinetobacter sp. YH12027]|uniref:peptidoglycan DD-metalloendopeptidase family protein n=1 Tax=Acinetobacter sp. YH12027 TaxID=2601043 RepID=UPI0015D468B9|nr:peptidoglycan DD-metalloendopeptidase family protein [Acinetobacter sp. YH12027]